MSSNGFRTRLYYAKEITLPQVKGMFHAFLSLEERDAWVADAPYRIQGGGRFNISRPTQRIECQLIDIGRIVLHFDAAPSRVKE